MKTISVSSLKYGTKEVLVDDEDYDELIKYKWVLVKAGKDNWHADRDAVVNGKRCPISMHRQLLGLTNPKIRGRHLDGNGLNNTRKNLWADTRHGKGEVRKIDTNNSATFKIIYAESDTFGTKAVRVNAEDFEKLDRYKWTITMPWKTWIVERYEQDAYSKSKRKIRVLMSQMIMGLIDSGIEPRYRDKEGLNCTRKNLRVGSRVKVTWLGDQPEPKEPSRPVWKRESKKKVRAKDVKMNLILCMKCTGVIRSTPEHEITEEGKEEFREAVVNPNLSVKQMPIREFIKSHPNYCNCKLNN